MADYTVKRFDEMEPILGGVFRRARASLGASAFGMQVLQMPAGADFYPNHDHSHDGQEEVYTVLAGTATLTAGGRDYELESGVFARVGPQESRKITTGDEGARVLAIGASPGRLYEAPEFTEEGQPDPMAG